VLVGSATGVAYSVMAGGLIGQAGAIWLTIGAAVLGAVVGAVVSRFSVVPWDGLALVVLALGLVLRSPRGQLEFADQDTYVRLAVVFTVGFVLATSLTALATRTSLSGIGGPGEVGALVGLGFVASLLAPVVVFPTSRITDLHSLGLGPALTVATAAVGVLALYGLGRLARSLRRAIEAEARREAALTPQ
jgi:hypothetical protein